MKTFVFALATGFGLAALPAVADTFVLVHGAFQTSASWAAVADGLRAAGQTAVTVDLAGRPGDGRDLATVTLADDVDLVLAAIKAAKGPVVLVGHSFGGMVISAVAEADPKDIASLVYVAAYLPQFGTQPGQSMQDLATADHHGAWQKDSFVLSPDYAFASVNPRDRVALFAADADAALGQSIADAMVNEPLAPLATPVPLTDANFGTVRKAYIVTLRDRAVSTDLQLTMLGRAHVDEAIPLDTGHAPQEVNPEALVAALLRAATPELE